MYFFDAHSLLLLQGGNMKSKWVKLLILVAAGALLLVSCESSIGVSKSAVSDAGKGTVTISIPRLNPFIAASQAASSKSANSKAFGYVDSIEVDFYQMNGSTEEFVRAVNLGTTEYDEATNTITGSVSILAGDYSKMIVSVFNNVVSTAEPIVAGQTDAGFTVTAGATTDLNVTLYPYSPTTLPTENVFSAEASLEQYGETWYSFEAPGTIAKVTLQETSGNLEAYIFDPNGDGVSGIADSDTTAQFDTTPYGIYYICLIAPDGAASGKVKFENVSGTVNITFH